MSAEPDRAELRERERTLRRACEVVSDRNRRFAGKIDELFEVVRDTLGTEIATLSRVHEEAGEYIFERIAAPADLDVERGDRTELPNARNCKRVVETEKALVFHDVEAVAPEQVDPVWGISCYLGAPVVVDGEVYGTFCFYDRTARETPFSEWEVRLVELLSDWVSYELTRQRYVDRVAALNDINETVRGVIDVVIGESTRADIERAACESLAAAGSFEFAWIGEADPETGTLRVRTEAGVEDALGELSLSVESDGKGESGREEVLAPPAAALRETETRVQQDAGVETTHEGWRSHAERFDYEATASVPVTHAGAVYGVVTVHADRPHAFAGEERAAMTHLGELLGHAIAAAERRRALAGDAVVELTFAVRNALAAWDVSGSSDEPVLLHELVEVGDGRVIAFGSTSKAGLAVVRELGKQLPICEGVTRVDERTDDVAFEAQFSEMPLVSRLAALGGHVDQILLDGDDARLTAHFAPDVDVRQVREAVRSVYPDAEVVAKRDVSRSNEFTGGVRATLTETLTDKQLEALRTAYYAGYFERPRDASGEEIATRLGVSNSTFSQHLRAAQTKILRNLLGEPPES